MKTFSSVDTGTFGAMSAARNSGSARSTLLSGIGHVLRSIVEFPHRHAVRSELNNLSDRELADIGLSRADVPHVFDGGFAPRRTR